MKRPLAGSDDETESELSQSLFVSSYHLVDDDDEPVSFSVLPIQWSDSESVDYANNKGLIFLHGSADNGLQKIFMQVIAWRFDLSGVKPEISLLSKDRKVIKLQKPRKSFQATVRTVLITIYFLHRVKKNPRMSAKGIWKNLCKDKDLSSYGFKSSRKDLLDHMPLIGEAAKRVAVLAQSKLLLKVLGEKLGIQKLSDEEVEDLPQPESTVDDNATIDEANEDSNAEDDSVCAICDNGGKLLCCEGACMRSFHATKEDGRDSMCDSLGFTQKEVDEIESFYCKNCEYHQHQCFSCGKLGSSDKVKGAEVIKCATCDSFYHPHCVAKLLPRVVKQDAVELEKNIADGDPFTCPIHYCCVCKGLENKMEPELQFAICRRCPKSYHRKCLPREITFDCVDDEDIIPRAWEGLFPNNRILIYCLNHEIDEELRTPIRDHIKFPDTGATIREINTTSKKMEPATKKRGILKKNSVGFDNSSGKSTAKGSEVPRKLSSTKVGSKKSPEKMISGSDISRKLKSNEISRTCLTEKKSISKKFEMPNYEKNKQPTGEKLCALKNKGSERIKHDDPVDDVVNKTLLVKPTRSVLPPSDADSERRNHEIGDELRTPIRDHIKFPDTRATIPKINTTNKRMKPATKKRVILKKNSVGFDNSSGKSSVIGSKVPEKLSSTKVGSNKSPEKMISGSDISRKRKSNEISRSCLTENNESISKKFEMPNCEENNQPTGEKLCVLMNKGSEQIKHDNPVDGVFNKTLLVKPTRSVLPPSDADSEKRNHEIVDELQTPRRDYIKFPDTRATSRENNTTNKRMKPATKKRVILKNNSVGFDNSSGKSSAIGSKVPGTLSSTQGGSKKPSEKMISGSDISRKQKSNGISRSCLTENKKSVSKKFEMPNCEKNKQPTGEKLCGLTNKGSERIKHDDPVNDVVNKTLSVKPIRSVLPPSAADSEKSLLDLFKEARSSEGAIEKHTLGNVAEKTITMGQEYRMSKSSKTSRKRKRIKKNDRRGLGVASLAKRRAVNGAPERAVNGVPERVPDHIHTNPIDGRFSVESFQSKSVVACARVEVDNNDDENLEPMSDFGRSYSGTEKGPSVASPLSDCGVTDIEEHHSMGEEKHRRESDIRQQVDLSGVQNPNSTECDHPSGRNPSCGYMGNSHAQPSPVTESSYKMNTPVVERYAPRVDELNHVRMSSLGPEPPIFSRSGTFERRAPLPGFASGLNLAYSRQHSAGWLDE